MAIPKFNKLGLLPPGIHECTMREVRGRFGSFSITDRRVRLFERLQDLASEAQRTGLVDSLIIDGSFVTDKAEPDDVDLIIVLAEGRDFTGELMPMDYNVLSRRRIKSRFKFDVFVGEENSPEYKKHLTFFQVVRGLPDVKKGLLKVRI